VYAEPNRVSHHERLRLFLRRYDGLQSLNLSFAADQDMGECLNPPSLLVLVLVLVYR
jgi:hypothetical protein